MNHQMMKKIISCILVMSLVLTPFLTPVQKVHAYSSEERDRINHWFSTESKTETPRNLRYYQDNVNTVFESFLKIFRDDEDASQESLAQSIKTFIDAIKSDDIMTIIEIEGIDENTYNEKEREQKIKYDLFSLSSDNYTNYIPSIVDVLSTYMCQEEIAFTKYANNTSNIEEYCNAVSDLIHGIREGVTRVDVAGWESKWSIPSAYDYKEKVDAVITAYQANGDGMTKAMDELVAALKADAILSELKLEGFTDISTLTSDEDWSRYDDGTLSCERRLADYLYSINAKKINGTSYDAYVDVFQKRLKEEMDVQKGRTEEGQIALYRYMNGDAESYPWALQDLVSGLYHTVRDVDEASWESEWSTPSAYDYKEKVDAVITAYQANGDGMTKAIDELVVALKTDAILSELKLEGFTDISTLTSDEDWSRYDDGTLSCERRLADYLYSINAKKINGTSYDAYVDVFQKRLKEEMDVQKGRTEEGQIALYRYMNGDAESYPWALQDLVSGLYHTVRDVDEASWESEWSTPSAYDYKEKVDAVITAYQANGDGMTKAIDELVVALKADTTLCELKSEGFTDINTLKSEKECEEYWNQERPCEKRVADYLYSMKPKTMQGESYSSYMKRFQERLQEMQEDQAKLGENEKNALCRYWNGKEDEIAYAIADMVFELYYTIQDVDNKETTPTPIPTPTLPSTGESSDSPSNPILPTSEPTITPQESTKTEQVIGDDHLTTTITTKTTTDENGNTRVEENRVVTDKKGTVKETIVTSQIEDKKTGASIKTVLQKDSSGNVIDASMTLQTAIHTKVEKGKAAIDVIAPEQNLIDVSKQTLSKGFDVTIELPKEKIIHQITNNEVKEVEIKIPISSNIENNKNLSMQNINLSKEIIESAKETGTSMKIVVTDEKGAQKYSVSFDREKLENSTKKINNINLNLDIKNATQSSEIKKVLKNDNNNKADDAVVLDFSHSGELPVTMNVNVYVGKQADLKPGTKVYMYYMNPTSKKLDRLPNNEYTVDQNLFVNVMVNHCSEYILLPNEVSKEVQVDLLDQISLIQKRTLYFGGTKGGSFTLKPTMPSTLEKVSKFGTVDDLAISEVKVSFETDNKKVVKVNKSTGKVNAVGIGKAIIATTFQLANGQQRIVKTVVTVKRPYIKITSKTTSYKVGKTYSLSAKSYGIDGDVTWSVSDSSVAVIGKETGKIRICKKGTVIVTATCGKIQKTRKIVVK